MACALLYLASFVFVNSPLYFHVAAHFYDYMCSIMWTYHRSSILLSDRLGYFQFFAGRHKAAMNLSVCF